MEILPGQQEAILHQIFSRRRIERQTPRHSEQAPRMAHDDTLELVLAPGHKTRITRADAWGCNDPV
jgi:hypothetical protein